MFWVRLPLRARSTTLGDKVCEWLAVGQWYSPGPPVSSTNKTDGHDRTGILLKVAWNTIKPTFFFIFFWHLIIWLQYWTRKFVFLAYLMYLTYILMRNLSWDIRCFCELYKTDNLIMIFNWYNSHDVHTAVCVLFGFSGHDATFSLMRSRDFYDWFLILFFFILSRSHIIVLVCGLNE
jgi:hypothetical protein